MDDQYSLCESAVITSLLELDTYFPNAWQVSDNDANRSKGANPGNYMVFRPGAFPILPGGTKEFSDFGWVMVADLYVKFTEYQTALRNFKAVRWAVVEKLMSDMTLSHTKGVWNVSVASPENVMFFFEKQGQPAPNFVTQALIITVNQRVKFTRNW